MDQILLIHFLVIYIFPFQHIFLKRKTLPGLLNEKEFGSWNDISWIGSKFLMFFFIKKRDFHYQKREEIRYL